MAGVVVLLALQGLALVGILIFFARMRGVGKLLGEPLSSRMNMALMLSVVVPLGMSFVWLENQHLMLLVRGVTVISFCAGLVAIPGILREGLKKILEPVSVGEVGFDQLVRMKLADQKLKRGAAVENARTDARL